MKRIVILFSLLFSITGCEIDSSIERESTDFEIGALVGSIRYFDLALQQVVTDNSKINSKVSLFKRQEGIVELIATTQSSYSFEFVSLAYGSYYIKATSLDSATGLSYEDSVDFEISAMSKVEQVVLSLVPTNQVITVGTVNNSSNMPIKGCEVYLYSDEGFLKRFLGSAGFVDSSISNQYGRVVFTNHLPGDYFLFARLVLNNDTLISDTTNLTSIIVNSTGISNLTTIIQ